VLLLLPDREVREGSVIRYTRLHKTGWRVDAEARGSYWLSFETERFMVPVEKIRNPLAGTRRWALRVGRASLKWR
jgi:hypothetical protein